MDSSWALWLKCFAAVVISIWRAAFAAMVLLSVVYATMLEGTEPGADDLADLFHEGPLEPRYRVNNKCLAAVLLPAHQVDRAIRPGHWNVEP